MNAYDVSFAKAKRLGGSNMRWHEVTIYTTEEAIEMVTNFMHELGAGGVSIEESGTLINSVILHLDNCTINR
jgi:ribosomal protein L11 methylase PrmA